MIAVYKRPYPFFWHERYGDERTNREPESPEGIQITTRPQKLSSQCELGSHTVLDGCMVLTNQALYKCRPRYELPHRCEGFVYKERVLFIYPNCCWSDLYLPLLPPAYEGCLCVCPHMVPPSFPTGEYLVQEWMRGPPPQSGLDRVPLLRLDGGTPLSLHCWGWMGVQTL